jgi:hypothetical protein
LFGKGVARSGEFGSVKETTIVLARRPIDAAVVGCTKVRLGEARQCSQGLVAVRCSTSVLVSARPDRTCRGRFLTTPVQARFPIDAGGVGCI